jgi:hypothetical protein
MHLVNPEQSCNPVPSFLFLSTSQMCKNTRPTSCLNLRAAIASQSRQVEEYLEPRIYTPQ